MGAKKRYLQVGLGGRAGMYTRAVLETYAECSEMVGFCDNNEGGRAAGGPRRPRRRASRCRSTRPPTSNALFQERQAECVIVTTKDCWHDHYVCRRRMELGCDAITEKPMTTEAEIVPGASSTAQRKTGKKCRVSPSTTATRALATQREGPAHVGPRFGEVPPVEFHWLLDTSHGADYFRRWHRNKENSGGLMVHKATHHFDLVNWWALGRARIGLRHGTEEVLHSHTAERYGLKHPPRSAASTVRSRAACRFYLDLRAHEHMQRTFTSTQEEYDGYFRDRCVFSDSSTSKIR